MMTIAERTTPTLSHRERELGAIITAYNEVTDRLKDSHDRLTGEVRRLRGQIEQKDRELARRQRLAALGEMAAGVAHEIRNPLAGIQLCATMLQKDLAAQPAPHKLASQISQGVRMLDAIVRDILAFAGPNEPRLEDVPLMRVIESSLASMALSPGFERAPIDIDPSVESMVIRGEQRLLERAMVNLLSNAVEASGVDGRVRVYASVGDEDNCLISIADNGPGIERELAERIFNPFFTTKDKGAGLGLAIVHRIIDAHGGSIRVLPAHGGGTEFQLSLPFAANQQLQSEDQRPWPECA